MDYDTGDSRLDEIFTRLDVLEDYLANERLDRIDARIDHLADAVEACGTAIAILAGLEPFKRLPQPSSEG